MAGRDAVDEERKFKLEKLWFLMSGMGAVMESGMRAGTEDHRLESGLGLEVDFCFDTSEILFYFLPNNRFTMAATTFTVTALPKLKYRCESDITTCRPSLLTPNRVQ